MAAVATSLYPRPTAADPPHAPDEPDDEPCALSSDLRKPLGLPPRSTSLGAAAPAGRHAAAAVAEPRVSVYSTNGTVYERAAVVGYSLGSDGVVYYLLEVRSWESPLEGYVVRRRYNDFRRFHDALAQWMPPEAGRARSASSAAYGAGSLAAIGGGFSSLLLACSPASAPDPSPTYQRPRSASSSVSEQSAVGRRGEDRRATPETLSCAPGATYYDRAAVLPLDEVKFTLSGRARLPALPGGGLLPSAFLTAAAHAQLIAQRRAQFNRVLAAALSDASPHVAREVMLFVQEKPDALAHSYTTLAEYSAISMPFTVERRARRRAMSMGRQLRDQPSSASDSSSVGTTG